MRILHAKLPSLDVQQAISRVFPAAALAPVHAAADTSSMARHLTLAMLGDVMLGRYVNDAFTMNKEEQRAIWGGLPCSICAAIAKC